MWLVLRALLATWAPATLSSPFYATPAPGYSPPVRLPSAHPSAVHLTSFAFFAFYRYASKLFNVQFLETKGLPYPPWLARTGEKPFVSAVSLVGVDGWKKALEDAYV